MGTICEKQYRFLVCIGRGCQDGVMAGGMEAEHHLGPRGPFDAEALNADGNAAVGTDPEGGAEAPNIGPLGAAWGRAQHGPLFFLGEFPGPLWGHA